MAKFKESDLTEILKEFQQKSEIEIEFEKSLSGKIKIEDATVTYNSKNGFVNIDSEMAKFKLNTTLVFKYEKNKDAIYIDMDSILVKIKKSSSQT